MRADLQSIVPRDQGDVNWHLLSNAQREEALSSGQLLWRKIFDQQNFVTLLTVYELVNEVPSHQDAVAARTQSSGFADKNVTNRIIRRIVDSCMVYFSQRETLARILKDRKSTGLNSSHL